jgi:hypothetical protein
VTAVERGEACRDLGVIPLYRCLPGRDLRPFEEILGVVPGQAPNRCGAGNSGASPMAALRSSAGPAGRHLLAGS